MDVNTGAADVKDGAGTVATNHGHQEPKFIKVEPGEEDNNGKSVHRDLCMRDECGEATDQGKSFCSKVCEDSFEAVYNKSGPVDETIIGVKSDEECLPAVPMSKENDKKEQETTSALTQETGMIYFSRPGSLLSVIG